MTDERIPHSLGIAQENRLLALHTCTVPRDGTTAFGSSRDQLVHPTDDALSMARPTIMA